MKPYWRQRRTIFSVLKRIIPVMMDGQLDNINDDMIRHFDGRYLRIQVRSSLKVDLDASSRDDIDKLRVIGDDMVIQHLGDLERFAMILTQK